MKYVISLAKVNAAQLEVVGGKNASIGEMIQHLSKKGIRVPGGFATTSSAFQLFIKQNQLDKAIHEAIQSIRFNNIQGLNRTSAQIRKWIVNAPFSEDFERAIQNELKQLKQFSSFAVRSSATAEDLPEASFAGQQETFLNVKGLKNILHAIKLVFASLFTSRAIHYRYQQKLDQSGFSISVGIQPMIRSDKGASGVMFTLDTESGFDQVVLINASYGLGEGIVQGKVNPDEFCVYKPALQRNKSAILQKKLGEKALKMIYGKTDTVHSSIRVVPTSEQEASRFCITDEDIHTLANYAVIIEQHYKMPMDIEWAKDGVDGLLYILQARPETVNSKQNNQSIKQYKLLKKGKEKILVQGLSIGQKIGSGKARIIRDVKKIHEIKPGDVLVTDMTDPDWEPVMKLASAIVTNRGGRTCHAAIIARELGIPAVVGCNHATSAIRNGDDVTVSCAEGETGFVYEKKIPFDVQNIVVTDLPKIPVDLCLNVGNPDSAFSAQFLPNCGVGLARLEFIISNLGVHPNAVLKLNTLPKSIQHKVKQLTKAYSNPAEYYVEKLREGISKIAASFSPKPVIFRFSDFKTNEYANLLGGSYFEMQEENPMIGFRGASRYYDERFREAFLLECEAFKRVREDMGLINAQVMIPFVRTVDELKKVIRLIEKSGLKRGKNGLRMYMMCEVPSNVILAEQFLEYVDGYSIGSNDLTQLVLGLDRDSTIIASLFDERNDAVKQFLHHVIQVCNKKKKYIGICGQGPSDHPDFAEWLVKEGIQCMSLNADTVVETWMRIGKKARL